jgi:hypothetical protein
MNGIHEVTGSIPVWSTILRSRSVWRTTPCSVTRRPLRVRQRERSRSLGGRGCPFRVRAGLTSIWSSFAASVKRTHLVLSHASAAGKLPQKYSIAGTRLRGSTVPMRHAHGRGRPTTDGTDRVRHPANPGT